MRIAIFADVHGKILLPFKMASKYNQLFDKQIDLILQCGDLGAFPDLSRLDKATVRHAKEDRDELGFYDDFVNPKREIQNFLETLNLNMICVRGNHEDHDFLDTLEAKDPTESAFSIDCYERVFVCKTGHLQKFQKENIILSFMGVGRVGDRKKRPDNKIFIQEYEKMILNTAIQKNLDIQILITHDAVSDMTEQGYGMPELRKVLDGLIPQYHFYGHTGHPFKEEYDTNEITKSVKIKELEFDESGALPFGCMVVLEVSEDNKLALEVVSLHFTNQFTKYNWHYR
jgi:predicted phosphodiesterase